MKGMLRPLKHLLHYRPLQKFPVAIFFPGGGDGQEVPGAFPAVEASPKNHSEQTVIADDCRYGNKDLYYVDTCKALTGQKYCRSSGVGPQKPKITCGMVVEKVFSPVARLRGKAAFRIGT
jgi:hypothetical protein